MADTFSGKPTVLFAGNSDQATEACTNAIQGIKNKWVYACANELDSTKEHRTLEETASLFSSKDLTILELHLEFDDSNSTSVIALYLLERKELDRLNNSSDVNVAAIAACFIKIEVGIHQKSKENNLAIGNVSVETKAVVPSFQEDSSYNYVKLTLPQPLDSCSDD